MNASLPLLALERNGSNALLRRYSYGRDLVSMTTGAGAFYYHRNALGSIANLTSSTGATQWTYSYEPFGAKRTELKNNTSAPTNLMRFTGELLDTATTQYHLRARQYDPAVGRFTATDPLPPLASDPYVSSYAYANNRPTILIDPSGLAGEPGAKKSAGVWDWIREDQLGWRDGCANSTACWLNVEANILTTVFPWGRLARAGGKGVLAAKGATEGIYVIKGARGTYVGQSGNIPGRLAEHVRSGRFTQAEVDAAQRMGVSEGRTAREIAEQKQIDELGGIDELLNLRNPIGPRRFGLMPEGYMR